MPTTCHPLGSHSFSSSLPKSLDADPSECVTLDKYSIAFLLGGDDSVPLVTQSPKQLQQQTPPRNPLQANSPPTADTKRVDKRTQKQQQQQLTKRRQCQAENCSNEPLHQRRFCRVHWQRKRCQVDDCNRLVQRYGLCWKHGGFKTCRVEGCDKQGKTKGLCCFHGGGARCVVEDCTAGAMTDGLCWAHGGGQRCEVPECHRRGCKELGNVCHFHRGGSTSPSGNRP